MPCLQCPTCLASPVASWSLLRLFCQSTGHLQLTARGTAVLRAWRQQASQQVYLCPRYPSKGKVPSVARPHDRTNELHTPHCGHCTSITCRGSESTMRMGSRFIAMPPSSQPVSERVHSTPHRIDESTMRTGSSSLLREPPSSRPVSKSLCSSSPARR